MTVKNTVVALVCVALSALIAGVWLSTSLSKEDKNTPQHFQTFPAPRQLATFQLVNQDNQAVTNSVFDNKWTLLFLGYTFCPDVCPTTLAALNQIYPSLQNVKTSQTIQVVFISVDPQRDTPQRLHEYVNYFNPEFVALTGEHAQLFPLVRSLGLMYAMVDDTEQDYYLVDHSASIVLINPEGLAVGRFKPEHIPGQVAISDKDQILADLPSIVNN